MLEKGLVQVYTGDGKGKTTAAFGLALRAAGQGNKVLIYQFLKPPSLDLGERLALRSAALDIRIEAMKADWDMAASFKDREAMERTRAAIREALAQLTEAARKRLYDVLVLDEIAYCLGRGLTTLRDVERLIEQRDPAVEIVLTGRDAPVELVALADLVTEMKKIKHPFDEGLGARRGIDY
ncbi:MAG TPA: cob(I)yrinic acid a,c-diamide adenosyltransferase [Sedimentisphaerales bacterium]|nr:cob(I)yrinic acid a,c-diamide adenosyltransferase [Sedimentisphaerales bacterium]HRS12097.1 cob(I)yrinic acid a,c-diamide adenosyltransferase [Sedimentisphaerales bacterium]HRV48695.1 cob(I)yrinic acid a,c-diamide adenosyltransferase [Sedimentisphaerales bacterium]